MYSQQLVRYSNLGISLDFSKLPLGSEFMDEMADRIQLAFADMKNLESGAIANADEGRMVGHYWLRNADLAPNAELKAQILDPIAQLRDFANKILTGEIIPPSAVRYTTALVIGIGGSALGPELVADALPNTGLNMKFLDNTDPEGIYKVLDTLSLEETLVIVISKSGGTPETRNGMLLTQAYFMRNGVDFASQAVAITGHQSQLDKVASSEKWLARFPMEDWVGGRTSVMSIVGLLPAALQGVAIEEFLTGAKDMDTHTRQTDAKNNAAMKLALAWFRAGNGKGSKDMVVLPYKDSLVLFSKYLQQLIMESIGKQYDRDGNQVFQGLAVYGNKGSTDQHAYVQQLRDGIDNFFVTFIEVRQSPADGVQVDEGITAGDYLQGFMRGTREALAESGRASITISIPEVTAYSLGMLVALFERSVSFYASLVNVNAYHQPGVEAGKKAAGIFLNLLGQVKKALTSQPETAQDIASRLNAAPEAVYHCLVHIAESQTAQWTQKDNAFEDSFHI